MIFITFFTLLDSKELASLHYCHHGKCYTTIDASGQAEYHCECDKNVYVGDSCEVSFIPYKTHT